MHATNPMESAVGAALFLGAPLNITQWSVRLFSTPPDEAGAGGVELPAAGGYAPVRHDPGSDRWVMSGTQDADGRTVFQNNSPISFPAATAAWPTATHVVLSDQSGLIRFVVPLDTPITADVGDVPVWLPGALRIAIG